MLGAQTGSATARRVELGFFAVCLSFLIFELWPLLTARTTFISDALNINFPLYHYLAHNLMQGRWPLWNPYTHGGEPFYPLLLQMRLIDPLSVALIWVGKFFTRDTLLLFNWDRILQLAVNLGGVYLLLRPYAQHLISRLVLVGALMLSSFFVCVLRQDGFLSQFAWMPFIAYFLVRIVFAADGRWRNFLALSLFLGLRWQSYWFVGPATFLLFATGALLLCYRPLLWQLRRLPQLPLKLTAVLIVNLAMAVPNLVTFLERDRFDFPLRANPEIEAHTPKGTPILEPRKRGTNDPLRLDYDSILHTGSNLQVEDYLQTASPANAAISANESLHGAWGSPSEASLYFGTLCWGLTLVGLFFARHPQARFWLVQVVGFALLGLGPYGGLHRLLFLTFPPIWFVRHCYTFVLLLVLALFFFLIQGTEKILDWLEHREPLPEWRGFLHAPTTALCGLIAFSLWIAVKAEFPEKLATPYFLFLVVASAWVLREQMVRTGYLAAIIAAQAALVLILQPRSMGFVLWFFWNAGVPLALFLFCARLPRAAARRTIDFCLGLMLMVLVADLAFFLDSSWPLFRMVPRPDKFVPYIETYARAAPFPRTRQVYEYAFSNTAYQSQAMRYHSLLTKRTAVLTPVHSDFDHRDLGEALRGRRFSGYLGLKEHGDLVYSSLSPRILEKIFGVGQPMLQFRTYALDVKPGRLVPTLARQPESAVLAQLEEAVFLEGAPAPVSLPLAWHYPTRTDVTDFTENSLSVEVESSQSGYLLWLDGMDTHWRASVDGIDTPLFRANGFAKAVALPSGVHTVRFEYRPLAFLRALALFYFTFALCASAWGLILLSERLSAGRRALARPAFSVP